jgi:putative redox protein
MKIVHKGDMLFQAQVGNHTVTADVSMHFGGNDRAATPPDYFVFSLGSCAGAMIAGWCYENNLDPEDLTVNVDYKKSMAGISDIKMMVDIPSVNMKERWKDIVKVVDSCPVHKALQRLQKCDVQLEIKGVGSIPCPPTL